MRSVGVKRHRGSASTQGTAVGPVTRPLSCHFRSVRCSHFPVVIHLMKEPQWLSMNGDRHRLHQRLDDVLGIDEAQPR